jgi:hypothetical protein
MEGRPWPEWKGKPISSNAVARLLKAFGIKPGCVGDRKKDSGYEVKQFEEAFTRYLSPSATSATPAALKTNGNSEKQSSANDLGAELSNRRKGNEINGAGDAEVESPSGARARYWPRWRHPSLGNNPMSCRSITEIIRQARGAGILIELDANGDLRLRATNQPPQAMVQHLREHKRELVAFLRAKAVAGCAEARLTVDAKAKASGPGDGRAASGFGICDRCGRPPTKGNELIAQGLTMTVHEKCWKGRGGRKPRHRPKTGGDGAALDEETSPTAAELVPVGRKQ